jgi:hypothetical protein
VGACGAPDDAQTGLWQQRQNAEPTRHGIAHHVGNTPGKIWSYARKGLSWPGADCVVL